MIGPAKWPGRRCLIAAAHANCIVRLGGAEPIAPLLLTHVRACSRIDQDLFLAGSHHNAQRIRMAVAGAPGPESSSVEDHLIAASGHYGDAGI